MIVAVTGSEQAWLAALGLGLVVALVVTLLLEILRRRVHAIRVAVDDVLARGGRLAQHTWTVQILQTATERAGKLLAEVEGRKG